MYTLNNSLSMTWKAPTTLDDHIPVAEVDWGIFYLEGFLPINKWANRIFKKKFTFSFLVLFSSTHWRETARMRAPRRWACYVQSNFQLVRNRTGPGILNQLIDGWRCPQKAFGRLDTKHDVQAIRSGMPAVPSSGWGKKNKTRVYRLQSMSRADCKMALIQLYIKLWMTHKKGVNPIPPAMQMTVLLFKTPQNGLENGPST